jgi:spoIIIJ-associated protein
MTEESPATNQGGDRRRRRRGSRGGHRNTTQAPRPVHVPAPAHGSAATLTQEPPEVAPIREMLIEILKRMGLTSVQIGYYVRPEGEYLEVRGTDLAGLIGRHGNTLEALNLVFNNMVNAGQRNGRRYYTIDAEGYRARRADALKSLALQALERAVREKRPQILEPMLPSERKIIHIALAESPFVGTESSGVEPERRVVVTPK